MKPMDKVTLTYGQLKRLIKENRYDHDDCYALHIRDMHTVYHHLYTGDLETVKALEEIVKEIEGMINSRNGNDDELVALYDAINTYDYGQVDEINFREIDDGNDYYDYKTGKTYHIINDMYYDMN